MSENEDFKIFMAETTIYRKSLCEKIDNLNADMKEVKNKVNGFPCIEQNIMVKGIKTQLKYLWGFVAAMVLFIFEEWTKKR